MTIGTWRMRKTKLSLAIEGALNAEKLARLNYIVIFDGWDG